MISEYAPGQYELTLHYRKNILRAADDLVLLKRLVRMQARRHGVTACFMAKPIEKYAGSGMHFHVSMQDNAGTNIFAEATGANGPRPPPRHRRAFGDDARIHAGLCAARQLLAAFRPQSYAPLAPTWGVNNRSVALRVPAGDVKTGVSSIGLLASTPIPISWRQQCLPGSPRALTKSSILARKPPAMDMRRPTSSTRRMPADWRSAIEAAKASAFLKDALGEDLHRTFTAIKQAEYMRVARTVSELDYHLYLHEV